MLWFGVASYVVAALAYGAFAAMLLTVRTDGRQANWLVAATIATAVWGACIAALMTRGRMPHGVFLLDALHCSVWTAAAASYLSESGSGRVRAIVRWLWPVSAALTLLVGIAPLLTSENSRLVFPTLILLALLGLLAVEQVARNASERPQSAELFAAAIGAIFVIDLFIYAQATLLGSLTPYSWEARGLANAVLVPVMVVALRRQASWHSQLFVSRHVVFYTASLVGVGIYLLAMGTVAYSIREMSGEWSLWLELVFLAAAVALLIVILFSASLRARAKVFLVKHFYRNKYDYREEWLRLTDVLGRTSELQPLVANALSAMARIVGSRSGDLWLDRDSGRYEWMAALDRSTQPKRSYEATDPLVAFLTARGWVIDSDEYARYPDRYNNAFGDPADGHVPPMSVIVPLDCHGELLGFVVLAKPREVSSLNFEDHDILKTAGRQVAVVLAHTLTQQRLAETKQFDAMNRLSTFLMHDLKNLVAQQELMLSNAQRFRHRPEFLDDMITTIRGGVERMRRVLTHLQHPRPGVTSRVDVSKLLLEIRSQCADREPVPQIDKVASPLWATVDREQLASVLTHLVRNAQDATPSTGQIKIGAVQEGGNLLLSVEDTGKGMDPLFIRDRLFRPFDGTKGASGMGIGAYQARETIRAMGGDVLVSSEVGKGTVFRLRIPQKDKSRCADESAA